LETAKDRLSYSPDALSPAEVFLDPLADDLTDPIAGMPGRAAIDCTTAATLLIANAWVTSAT
jgi:hypothetical protein